MTRKEFFKKLGIGVAAIEVTPKVIAETKSESYLAFDHKLINKRMIEYKTGIWIPVSRDEKGNPIFHNDLKVRWRNNRYSRKMKNYSTSADETIFTGSL